jgi:plasmid stability protein
MLRKKKPKGKPMNATTGTEAKAVRLELPADLHKQLRVEAAKHGQSMAALVRDLVEGFLAARKAT